MDFQSIALPTELPVRKQDSKYTQKFLPKSTTENTERTEDHRKYRKNRNEEKRREEKCKEGIIQCEKC
jgi:hypothetical protein